MKQTKRLLSVLLTLCLLLGVLPTEAFASPQGEATAAIAAVEEGTLLNIPPLEKELPAIEEAEDEELSLTLSSPQSEEAVSLTEEIPQVFSAGARAEESGFQLTLGKADNTYWYNGGDLGGTIGVSGASNGWSGKGRGNFNASVSGGGSSYTLTVAEKEKFKKSNIIYQPFALSIEVPAYSSKVLDLDLSIEGQRNSKGAASYYLELFIWGTGGDRAASTKFNVGETRNPTPGAAVLTTGYRYFSDSKSGGVSTGKLSLSFTNVSGTAKTVTYYMGAYVGMNSSTSLLSSYHHTLNAYFKFSASKVTTTEYAAAVGNTPYVWVNDAIREYNAVPGSYLRLFKDYYTNTSITLNQGGTVDLCGKHIWLTEGATLDVRGGSGTQTQIANGTIDGEAAAITHSGAGSLYLGDDGGKNPLKVFGQQTGVLNNGGDLYLLDGVQLRGSKENGIKNTGKGDIFLQGAPSIYGGTHDIDLGSTGLLRLRKALTNTSPISVYLPNYTASVEAPRRVTDVWSSKMGSADPNQYLDISVEGMADRPMPALVQQNLTGGGTALVARPYIVSLRPNGGSGVPAYIAIGPYRLITGLPTPTRPGYTFDGWFLNGDRDQPVRNNEIRCTSDVVLVAGWSYKKYIIIIENPDGTKTEKEIAPEETYGDSLPQPPTPPTGHEFDHWETSDGKKVDENTPVADTIDPATGNPKPLKPVYKAKTYTITFDYRIPGARPSTRRLEYGNSYGILPTTARKGYTFLGWYTHETAGEQVTADTPIPAGDQTLYAHWAVNSYTVSFDLNEGEGTAPPAQSVSYQAKYTLPADPTRTNYTFTGWYTAETGGTRVTADTILTNAADHTLYAQWSRKVYTATFQSDSKTVETRQVNAGDSLGALPSVTKTGYTLTSWGGVTAETVPTGSETYTAAWTANAYTVTLDPSGGTMGGSTTQSVTYDAAYGSLPTPTRTGYSFTGWFTAQSGGSQVNSASTVKKAADHTLYARWTANTYAVSFDADGGSVGTADKSVTFGQPYGTLPVPTRDGFNFVGWRDESGRTVSAATPVSTAEDHTLTARWAQRHEHKVNPNGGAGEVEFQELTAETVNGGTDATYTLTSGQWYLSGDITTTKPIYISGAVDLCLNGHTLTYTGEELRAIQLRENAVFNVCDCQGTGGIKGEGVAHYPGEANQDRNSTELLTSGSNTTINLYGVTLTSNATVVQTVANSTLTLDGARLVAEGQASYTLDAVANSSVTVKNSSIENEVTDAVRVSTSDFTVIGGSITTKGNRPGLYVTSDAQATLSGSPTIRGRNYDIFLYSRNSRIAVDGELTGQYRVNANNFLNSVSETAPWPVADALDKDYSAHFIPSSGDYLRDKHFAIRDVIEGGKHALEIYRFHRHQPCGGTSCAHSGPAHNGAVEYQPLAITGGVLNDGHYYLTEDITLTNHLKIQGNVSLCLNGHTIFAPGDTTGSTYNKRLNVYGVLALSDCKTGGKIINNAQTGFSPVSVGENGTLNLYSGIIEKTTSGTAVESPAGNKLATVNVYGGTIIASRAIDMANGDKTGNLLLSGSPVIQSTPDSVVFIGGKPGFLVLDGSLQKPSVPYQVTLWNMSTRDSHVVLTTGWPTMGDADPNDYFVSPKALELEKNEEGELVLRCHWVNKEGVGVIYLNANGDFKTGDLDQPDSRVGYLWDGWYTAENGGGRKLETGYNKGKIYEDDTTIYPHWTECDHSGHNGTVNNVDATCTTAAREQFTCDQCGLEVDRAVGEIPGHSHGAWGKDSGGHWRSCTACGAVDPDSRAQHTFGEPTGTEADCTQAGSQTRSCGECGYTLTETYVPLGHELAGWNSDENEHWNVCVREGCGVESEEKTPHTWGDWQLTSAPQVDVPGEETASCADCGRTKTRAVVPLPRPKYPVTYELDPHTTGTLPTQEAAEENSSITLAPVGDLARTGYQFQGWLLLDELGQPGETPLTGNFTMPGREVTLRIKWERLTSYPLKPGDTMVLEDGTVIKNESGGTVTIDKGGDGTVDTTIQLPEGTTDVTVEKDAGTGKDEVTVPSGSTVQTGKDGPVISIGGGDGKVDNDGKTEVPEGSTVTDGTTTITIKDGEGKVDPDGTLTLPDGGKVEVDKDGEKSEVEIPSGGEVSPVPEPGSQDVTGTVTDDAGAVSGARVELRQGTVVLSAVTTGPDGKFVFFDVPAGIYNLVAVKDGRTVTAKITVENRKVESTLHLPGNTSELVIQGKDTPDLVVGGLDREAERQSANIVMTVEQKAKNDATGADDIQAEAGDRLLDYLDVKVTRGGATLAETEELMELIIPFEFAAADGAVTIYRYHDGKAETLTPADAPAEGVYRLEREKGLIHIYAQKFSTYAIGYTQKELNVTFCTVSFDANGHGVAPAAQNLAVGLERVDRPEDPTEEGWRFGGWYTDAGCTKAWNFDTLVTGEMTLYAKWSKGGDRPVDPSGGDDDEEDTSGGRPGESAGTKTDRFTDVTEKDWFYDAVTWVSEKGLMVGTDKTHFSPHMDTSRAMIATILWRMEGSPAARGEAAYTDCAPHSWYSGGVNWADGSGVIKGYGDGRFGPDDPITREQLALMLWRYAGSPAAAEDLEAFTDAHRAGDWAWEALCWAVEKGILTGRGDGILDPGGKATRAEAAAMLMRYSQGRE